MKRWAWLTLILKKLSLHHCVPVWSGGTGNSPGGLATPCSPWGPLSPWGPCSPWGPWGPGGPWAPEEKMAIEFRLHIQTTCNALWMAAWSLIGSNIGLEGCGMRLKNKVGCGR